MVKGTTSLLFSKRDGELKVLEFVGDATAVMLDGDGLMHPDKHECLTDCVEFDEECIRGKTVCDAEFWDCVDLCEEAWPARKASSVHVLTSMTAITYL